MAKKSMIAREAKRARTVAKFAAKRAQLKEVIANVNTSDEERWEAQIALQKLPRNASPVRQQRRCQNGEHLNEHARSAERYVDPSAQCADGG